MKVKALTKLSYNSTIIDEGIVFEYHGQNPSPKLMEVVKEKKPKKAKDVEDK